MIRHKANRWTGSLTAMAGRVLPLSSDEFVSCVREAAASTPDDVSITRDGRRLDSKETVLAWLAEVGADRPGGHCIEFDEG